MADKHAPPPVAVVPAPSHVATPEPTNLTDREPIWVRNITVALGGVVAWAVSKGILDGTDETLAGVVIPVVAAGIAAWWARRSTTSVARAQDAIELAYAAQPGISPKPTL